ncbi:MAG: FkbM family methyltransferase [bacterium]|nr:FkbM family methyltransferase [bacterium]
MINPALKYRLNGVYKFITNPYERKFFWLSVKYGSRQRFLETNIKFLRYEFVVPDALSFIWQFKEIFVDEFYKFNTTSNNPVIYDCGANVGTSCAYFRYLYPNSRIVAFEPNNKIADYLEKNLNKNSFQNVEVVRKAVWIDESGIDLGMESADGSSIFLNKNKTKVDSVRLKNYLEKEGRIDMLKVDIEGAEIAVIQDCNNSLTNVQNIFVEFHSFNDQPQKLSDLLSVLEKAGFSYFIDQPENRHTPFINRFNKSNPNIELQLNIFAYRNH